MNEIASFSEREGEAPVRLRRPEGATLAPSIKRHFNDFCASEIIADFNIELRTECGALRLHIRHADIFTERWRRSTRGDPTNMVTILKDLILRPGDLAAQHLECY